MEPRDDATAAPLSPSPASGPEPSPPSLRRRARLVLAAFVVIDLLLVLGLWGAALGLPGWLAAVLLGVALAGGLLVIVIGLEPFRRWELQFEGQAEPETVHWWQVALFVLAPLALCVPLWHFLADEPWRRSIARAVGLAVYLSILYLLAKVQRGGPAPYWGPAWYGFFLAGVTAALVWSVVAGADVTEALATAFTGPLLHYAYVRWATRDAARASADAGAARDELTG